MDINYQPTPLILEAQEINTKVNALAPTLLKLSKTVNHASSNQAEVQTFTHQNGKKYLIAVNTDVENTSTVTILIDKSWLANSENATDIYTDEDFTIVTENENFLKITLPIEAADGRVILLEDDSYQTSIATSKTIYAPTEKVTVSYSGMEGNAKGDWLAIFPKNASSEYSNIADIENNNGWLFTGGSISGEIIFTSLNLANLPEGDYEVRAFFNDSYSLEATYTFSIVAE